MNTRNHHPEHIADIMARTFMQCATGYTAHITERDYKRISELIREDICYQDTEVLDYGYGKHTFPVRGTVDMTLSDFRFDITLSYCAALTVEYVHQYHSEVGAYESYIGDDEISDLHITSVSIYDIDGTEVVSDFNKNLVKLQ